MGIDTSVVVRYWISTDHPRDFPDLQGIDDFRNELSESYISVVRGRPSGAGGLVSLVIEIVCSFSLPHIARIILEGAVYDLIKEGSRSFVLRPLIAAYKRLKEKNRERLTGVREIRIEFQDCQLVIHEVSTDTVVDNLEGILSAVAQNCDRLALENGEFPVEIHVPVVEDPDDERPCRFRVIAHVDETIRGTTPGAYTAYWGVAYDRERAVKVYDVGCGRLIDERFNTVEEYWQHLGFRARAMRKAQDEEE